MVFFNYATMEMNAKIVYYGPGLCGKTTNLQQIHRVMNPSTRGELVSLATETDRTLFFDLLPIHLGNIGGFKTRFQLYTVPGQVFYNSTRKLVLKGADAIVFVADSQEAMLDANIESLENLQENLAELNMSLDELPWVIQYNKRDLPNILPVEELNDHINQSNVPYFEAIATKGVGVLETLKEISKLTLIALKKKTGEIEEEEEEEVEEEDVEFAVDEDISDEELDRIASEFAEQEGEELKEDDFDIDDIDLSEFDGEESEAEKQQAEDYEEEIDLDEELEETEAEKPAAKAKVDIPLAKAAGKPAYIKEVQHKVVIPILVRKDESLKDIGIHLKLEIECVITPEESKKSNPQPAAASNNPSGSRAKKKSGKGDSTEDDLEELSADDLDDILDDED